MRTILSYHLLVLLRCLKVVYRLDSANYLGGRLNVLNDLVHALISHRRLVKGIGNDAGGVDTRHLTLILCHRETLKGGGVMYILFDPQNAQT